jgi:polysaccharide chain length determinant protein (PEP-CTERM system associated)
MNSVAKLPELPAATAEPSIRPRPGSPRAITDFFDPAYVRSVARRRFWLVFMIGTLLSALGVFVAFVLPPTYRSSATILVESQQIPTELARSTITASAVEQIQVIEQRLLTRSTLLELAEKHRIFADRPTLSPTERVDRMRRAIAFELRNFGSGAYGADISTAVAFTVSFTADNPGAAAAVANELVTRILGRNAEIRRARASNTSEFFRQEVDRLGRELARVENEIVTFEKDNKEALPQNVDYRREQLAQLNEQIQGFELQRIEVEQQKSISRLTLEEETRSAGAPPALAMEQELAALRRALVQRQAVLTPSHPELRSLASAIAALEAALADALAEAQQGAQAAAAESETGLAQRIERRVAVFDAQLQFIDGRIATLKGERDEIERALLDTPNIEMVLNGLRRSREELEAQYVDAQDKLVQATIGERLEDRQHAQRFEVIEQPVAPERPQSPNRLKILAAGIVGGFGAGVGLAVLLELLSPVVRRPEDLDAIDVEALVVIPYIDAAGERARRWALRIAAILVVFGGSAAGLWATHTYYLPLETLAQKAVEKAKLAEPIDLVRRRLGL